MQSWRAQIVEWAARLQLPTVSGSAAFTENGALMSYSSNIPELYRRAATFVDKILRGAKPGDLPIEQPTSSNWSSIKNPRKRSASKFPMRFCCARTG